MLLCERELFYVVFCVGGHQQIINRNCSVIFVFVWFIKWLQLGLQSRLNSVTVTSFIENRFSSQLWHSCSSLLVPSFLVSIPASFSCQGKVWDNGCTCFWLVHWFCLCYLCYIYGAVHCNSSLFNRSGHFCQPWELSCLSMPMSLAIKLLVACFFLNKASLLLKSCCELSGAWIRFLQK